MLSGVFESGDTVLLKVEGEELLLTKKSDDLGNITLIEDAMPT